MMNFRIGMLGEQGANILCREWARTMQQWLNAFRAGRLGSAEAKEEVFAAMAETPECAELRETGAQAQVAMANRIRDMRPRSMGQPPYSDL